MDRYKVFPSGEMGMHPAGNWTPYADAQATVEALQEQLREGEAAYYKVGEYNDHLKQQVEALQRERDEVVAARDMWKREVYLIGDALRPLCGLSEYEFGWKPAVKIIADKLATLDATTPAPRQRQVHSCEIPGCVSCANPEEGGDGE